MDPSTIATIGGYAGGGVFLAAGIFVIAAPTAARRIFARSASSRAYFGSTTLSARIYGAAVGAMGLFFVVLAAAGVFARAAS